MFTVQAVVARGAQAAVAVLLVLERGRKEAQVRPWGARMSGLGPDPPARRAMAAQLRWWGGLGTPWPALGRPEAHLAAAPVATGVAVTLAELQLAVHARVARAAGAGIAPLPAVGARRPVLARGVVGAVIEICRDREQPAERGCRVIPGAGSLSCKCTVHVWPRGSSPNSSRPNYPSSLTHI